MESCFFQKTQLLKGKVRIPNAVDSFISAFFHSSAQFLSGISFRLSGTPNRKNSAKTVYTLRSSSEVDAERCMPELLLRCRLMKLHE
jgi:hypothetical protein